jgi:hypothetical protein
MSDGVVAQMEKRAAYYGLVVVTLLNFLNYIDRYILAAVLPRMQSELLGSS